MDDKMLDPYLRAYQFETDQIPSRQLIDNILAVPDQEFGGSKSFADSRLNPWHWFDLMIPKAVGWALTCCLGIYLGISSTEQENSPVDEEYYMYDQAQLLLSEDFSEQDMDAGDVD